MEKRQTIGSVKRASLTVLVDNKADLIVESSDRVKYFTDRPLLAEHGYSVLIQLEDDEDRILWDAGVSRVALLENLRRMKIDPRTIKQIALSHGHLDHYAALTDLLMEMELLPEGEEWGEVINPDDVQAWREGYQLPIVAHPAALRERWWLNDQGKLEGPYDPPPEQAWAAYGARMVLSETPFQLAPGCWTTGTIPRNSFETVGVPGKLRYRDGSEILQDRLEDDQAIVIQITGKGLVVLSGCAHSGIVNTIQHAMAFTGIDRVYAVIGGFHLSRASEEDIERTVNFFKDLHPPVVVPSHCTGLPAIRQFAAAMPDQFIEGVVGATYLL